VQEAIRKKEGAMLQGELSDAAAAAAAAAAEGYGGDHKGTLLHLRLSP
jgi:hypothetical protein